MRKKSVIKAIILTFSIVLLAACTNNSEAPLGEASGSSNGAINIMTSFYPMYEFTQQIAGDRANVDVMIPSGQDAHGYEPSAQDVAKVSEADVFVYSSDQMEYWVSDMLETVENDSLIVTQAETRLSERENNTASGESNIQEEHSHGEHGPEGGHTHSHGGIDPHTWLDPISVQEQVDRIAESLIEADPEGEEVYNQNAEAFKEELQSLHEDYETELAGAENRSFFTQHAAFGHLAERYNLEQISVGGLSTEVEPNPSRIAEIGELVNEHQVPVIYYQSGGNSSIAETVAAETGTETAPLLDLESQTAEMQEQDLDYIGAMRQNLENLKLSIQ